MSETTSPDEHSVQTEPPSPTSAKHASVRPLERFTARVIMVLAIGLSLYQLYTAGIAALTALVQRSIHLGAILSLTFLLRPPFKNVSKSELNVWVILDWCLTLAVCRYS